MKYKVGCESTALKNVVGVTWSILFYKSGNISEGVQDRGMFTTDRTAGSRWMALSPMALNDFKGIC